MHPALNLIRMISRNFCRFERYVRFSTLLFVRKRANGTEPSMVLLLPRAEFWGANTRDRPIQSSKMDSGNPGTSIFVPTYVGSNRYEFKKFIDTNP